MRPPRTSLLALPLAALALAAAGCGGSQVAADEVPGVPAALQVPTDAALGSSGSKADASSSTSGDEQSDSSGGNDSGAADTGTSGSGTTTTPPAAGTATPQPQATAAPDDTTGGTQPPAGSPPEQFENFCEQNAGAC
jgi:hypothetical protein